MWQVQLCGRFVAYEEAEVQRALEAARREGADSCEVTVRGAPYIVVDLQGAAPMQVSKVDASRRRPVRRVE